MAKNKFDKRSIMNLQAIFQKRLCTNVIDLSIEPFKIRLLHCYDVRWIHNIDTICRVITKIWSSVGSKNKLTGYLWSMICCLGAGLICNISSVSSFRGVMGVWGPHSSLTSTSCHSSSSSLMFSRMGSLSLVGSSMLKTSPLPTCKMTLSFSRRAFVKELSSLETMFWYWTVKTMFIYTYTAKTQVAHALPFLPCSTLRVKHLFLFRFSIGKCCLFTFAFARPEVKQPFKLSKRYNIRNIN